MKTYTLTPEAQEAFDEWYKKDETVSIIADGISNVLKAFFSYHPEHMTEQPSTSKRDDVLRVATAIYTDPSWTDGVTEAINIATELIAEVDKRFNPTHP